MSTYDITVESVNGDTLIALCSWNAFQQEWPSILVHDFKYWTFESLMPMPSDDLIDYSRAYVGCAKYVRCKDLT